MRRMGSDAARVGQAVLMAREEIRMANPSAVEVRAVPRARYVKMPETAAVKGARDLFIKESAPFHLLELIIDPVMVCHRLTVGEFRRGHWYASITYTGKQKIDAPNALSGWGGTAYLAIRELAFRWHVCMRGSWDPALWNLQLVPRWEIVDKETGKCLSVPSH